MGRCDLGVVGQLVFLAVDVPFGFPQKERKRSSIVCFTRLRPSDEASFLDSVLGYDG